MEYKKKSKNGDAGEHLAAYRFTKLLGWPCRLLDVDIGVDAELEIIAEDESSSGDIIEVQIKSFDKFTNEDAKAVYVSERHINYWKTFCLPVIICCVDLNSEKIYWTQIFSTEAYKTSGESNKISFNLVTDILDIKSKQKLQLLATPPASKNILPLFNSINREYAELCSFGAIVNIDDSDLHIIEGHARRIEQTARQIEELLLHFPWRASMLDRNRLALILNNLRITLNDASRSHSVMRNGM